MHKFTKKQLIFWASHQRMAYRNNELSQRKIESLESIDGWYWSVKEEAIRKAHEIFSRAQKRGSLPKTHSKNSQEKKDGRWVASKIEAKRGNGRGKWYPELDEMAKEYGFPNAFETSDLKEKTMDRAHEIFSRAKERESLPYYGSKDPQERKDAQWIDGKRKAKSGNSNNKWYPELDEIAKEYGFMGIFDIKSRKQKTLDTAHEVFQRAKKRGSLPKSNSKDFQGKKDASWLVDRRKAKEGRGSKEAKRYSVWYPEFDEIAKQYGFPNAFRRLQGAKYSIRKAHEIFQRAKERGSLPKPHSKNLQEKKDAQWISSRKRGKIQDPNGGKWYPEYDEIAKEYGFSDAFNFVDRKQIAIDKAHEIFSRAQKRGSLPNKRSKDLQEKKDGRWIQTRKMAKEETNARGSRWYPEVDEIAKQYGFFNAFRKKLCR